MRNRFHMPVLAAVRGVAVAVAVAVAGKTVRPLWRGCAGALFIY